MKIYTKYVKCSDCGRAIPIGHAYYLNNKPYGYSCYRKKLLLIYKQWEDEKNAEYSAECFAAMQVFKEKKSSTFKDSICKQWDQCKKLTAKQLQCIEKGFTQIEKIQFYLIWQGLTNDDFIKSSIGGKVKHIIDNLSNYMDNDEVLNCICHNRLYKKHGFHLVCDINEPEFVFIMENGKDNNQLKEDIADEELKVLKIINLS